MKTTVVNPQYFDSLQFYSFPLNIGKVNIIIVKTYTLFTHVFFLKYCIIYNKIDFYMVHISIICNLTNK